MGIVKRKTLISARSSIITVGGAVVTSVTEIDDQPIDVFDRLFFYRDITQVPVGAGTLLVVLQRPVVPSPVLSTDAHWEDLYRFPDITAASSIGGRIANIGSPVDQTPWSWTVSEAKSGTAIAADTGVTGTASYIRVVEVLTTDIFTTPAIYSLYMWTN